MASFVSGLGQLLGISRSQRIRPLVIRTLCSKPVAVVPRQKRKKKSSRLIYNNDWKEWQTCMKLQAEKSVLISAAHDKLSHIQEYCEKFGKIEKAIPFKTNAEFVLIQFESKDVASDVLSSCLNFMKEANIRRYTQTRFLEFSSEFENSDTQSEKVGEFEMTKSQQLSEKSLPIQKLQNCSSLSDQILLYYEDMKLSQLEIQLGFLVAASLESSLGGLFPQLNTAVLGSPTNGCVEICCFTGGMEWLQSENRKTEDKRNFSYYRKLDATDRSISKVIATLIATTLAQFGLSNKQIMNSFGQMYETKALSLPFQIYINNPDTVFMSILLDALGKIFDGLKPLTFVINQWAKVFQIKRLSNFQLHMLTVFYLQQEQTCILPPLPWLDNEYFRKDITDPRTWSLLFNNLNLKVISDKGNEKDVLEKLFRGFFQFYADFDFDHYAISLVHGVPVHKSSEHSLLLCSHRTFIHTVKQSDLNYFQSTCKITLSELDSKTSAGLTELLTK